MFEKRSLVGAAAWLTSVLILPSCVGTELVAHRDHPANPTASAGDLPATIGLLSDFDAEPSADSHDSHAGHGSSSSHEHDSTADDSSHTHDSVSPASPSDGNAAPAVRYTCPMHPEIVRGEPGTCPKCGMKLVPKGKDPK
ncbi:MAG TPA: heavy metal-binding domain-containing protein [Polyangiaceae bacterium]